MSQGKEAVFSKGQGRKEENHVTTSQRPGPPESRSDTNVLFPT